ncbi:hypothetical protein BDZ89DRAFT_220444 [Hymenopellis radicata]|nr:hypothetical protein BDZ89DRAFT_220444 [Hymenopellis radicata]
MPLTLVTICGIVVSTILHMKPEIFEQQASDGSRFRVSDSYLRKWLHETIGWSERRATRATQKTPDDWEDQCEKAILRIAYVMKEHDVPSALFVNTDQTQVTYAQGTKLTWAATGLKQVTTVGSEEKRAFTAVVSVANSGELLPLQAVYDAKGDHALLKPEAKNYKEAISAGFLFEASMTDTYWSTHDTMHSLVDDLLAPYFEKKKKELAFQKVSALSGLSMCGPYIDPRSFASGCRIIIQTSSSSSCQQDAPASFSPVTWVFSESSSTPLHDPTIRMSSKKCWNSWTLVKKSQRQPS